MATNNEDEKLRLDGTWEATLEKKSKLKSELLKEQTDITIVVLGETGVGKSTWINSFCNHMENTDDLTEAKYVYTPIYAKFMENVKYKRPTCHDERDLSTVNGDDEDKKMKYQRVLIEVGPKDENEEKNTSTVKSSTKIPRSYQLKFKEMSLTLVDTPGLDDNTYSGERAKEEDDKNISYILDQISTIEKINGFLILFKPKENRLDDKIRNRIKKMFSQLHSSALHNIVIACTHAKNTDFLEGETSDVLKELADELELDLENTIKNFFYFDNSPFRHLAIRAAGYEPRDDQEVIQSQWEQSVQNSVRLTKYVRKLTPHDTANTTSIQNTKMIIKLMKEPLLEMCKNISTTRKNLKRVFDKVNDEIKGEKRRAIIPTLVYRKLPRSQTVCMNSECYNVDKVLQSIGREVPRMIYDRVCCDCNCRLPTGYLNIGSVELKHCRVFNKNDDCKECHHSLNEHKHIKDIPESVVKEITATVEELRKKHIDLETEYKFIVSTMVFFTQYQEENVITTFHDSTTTHLDQDIKRLKNEINDLEKKGKDEKTSGGSSGGIALIKKEKEEIIQEVEQLKSDYEEEYRRSKSKGALKLTPEYIENKVNQLFQLEITGNDFKKIFARRKQDSKKYATELFDLNNKYGDIPKVAI